MLPDVANLTPFAAEVLPLLPPERDRLTLIVKGTFDVRPDGTVAPAAVPLPIAGDDEHEGDPATTPVRYESDLAPFKPRADLLCVGRAHAPGGRPCPRCVVRFGLAERPKTLHVVGDRRLVWEGGRAFATEPEPFTAMEISYARAFGGRDPGDPEGHAACPSNPLGRGYGRLPRSPGARFMHNLEDPARPVRGPEDAPPPAGFGPVGRTWLPRRRLAGTYDDRWLRERAPGLPEDFDFGYFNAAPADQQVEGYLRGDETLLVENMHPELARLQVRLPGVRARGFVEATDGRLRELPLRLDTVWLDAEALRLVLVWRGALRARHCREGGAVLVGAERRAAAPAPVEVYGERLAALRDAEAAVEAEVEAAERELGAA